MSERVEEFRFQEKQAQRLDKFLVTCLPEFSRTRLQTLIKNGFVLVNGAPAYKTGQVLEAGSVLQVNIPALETSELIPQPIPLDVLFEDDDLIVINKPAGMVVHPGAGHSSGTLVHAALAHAPEMKGIGGEQRPGVVHRLDKDTSGVILLAKNDSTHHWLQEQFRLRKVNKVYLTLVDGKPPTPKGRIDAPIGRGGSPRNQMAVVTLQKGREAISEYRTIETFSRHTLLEVRPLTGRTHQIRLHLKFIGCPVTGDTVYGSKHPTIPIERHFLHAARLSICLPGETTARTFEAPIPPELERAVEQLRRET